MSTRTRQFLASPFNFLAAVLTVLGVGCGIVAFFAIVVILVVGTWDGLVWLFKADWRTTNFGIPVLAFFVAVGFGIVTWGLYHISEALTSIGDRLLKPPRTIADRVIQIVSLRLGVTESAIAKGGRFIDDLGAEEWDVVALIREFEEEFDCAIPDEVAEKFTTVKGAIDFIEKHA